MPYHRARIAIAVATLLAFAGCAPAPAQSTLPGSGTNAPRSAGPSAVSPAPTSAAGASPAATLDRTAGWQADLAALVPGMDRLHPDLFHGVSKADLDAATASVSARVASATDDELMVGVLGIVAMVSSPETCDGHTGAFVWGTGEYPVDSLPLRLWLFDDDVVIVDALQPYENLIGSTIEAIDGHPIAEVRARLEPIIPRDNPQTIRLLLPRYLLIPQVLAGLGLADPGPVTLTTRNDDLIADGVTVDPLPMKDYNEWAGPYGLHLPSNPNVRWLSRIDDALWWEPLDDGETLFVQYNRVDRLGSGILPELRTALQDEVVTRVVLDLRHNYGGELSALEPIVDLFDDPAVDQPGKLFVAMGRNTFSAGSILVARLEHDTNATFVGEAAGGCPTLWGDSQDLLLPYSHIAVSVATEIAIGVDPKDPRRLLEPDANAALTQDEWAAGIDPVLELILPVAP